MSRKARHNPDDIDTHVSDPLVSPWQRLADDFPVLTKKAFKARLKLLSRHDQELAWKAIGEADPGRFGEAQAVAQQLKSDVRRIETIAVGSWADDFKSVAPAAHGEFPPGGKDTLMRRAKGERRLYPRQYLTTSGHSYDVFVQKVYSGRVQHLLDDDGYRGSITTIYDFHPLERKRFRRDPNGKHGASNSIDFDGIPD